MESQSRPRIDNRWPTRFAPLPIDAPRPAGTAVNDPESDRSRQTPRQAKLRSDVRRAIVQPCAEPAASPGRKPCRIYGRPTPPATNRPLLSQASRALTCQTDAVNGRSETVPSAIAGDDPLTIYVDKREIVTLMPLGGAPEAAGQRRCRASCCAYLRAGASGVLPVPTHAVAAADGRSRRRQSQDRPLVLDTASRLSRFRRRGRVLREHQHTRRTAAFRRRPGLTASAARHHAPSAMRVIVCSSQRRSHSVAGPRPGITQAGAISSSGWRTKARSCMRGCGSTSVASALCRSP